MAPLEIKIGSLLDGAAQASGAVAIIDVFRAFTTAAVVLANGASKIIMVFGSGGSVGNQDRQLARRRCAGERRGGHHRRVSGVHDSGGGVGQRRSEDHDGRLSRMKRWHCAPAARATSAWARSAGACRPDSISATHPSRCPTSIFTAGRSSSAPAPARRVSLRRPVRDSLFAAAPGDRPRHRPSVAVRRCRRDHPGRDGQ